MYINLILKYIHQIKFIHKLFHLLFINSLINSFKIFYKFKLKNMNKQNYIYNKLEKENNLLENNLNNMMSYIL